MAGRPDRTKASFAIAKKRICFVLARSVPVGRESLRERARHPLWRQACPVKCEAYLTGVAAAIVCVGLRQNICTCSPERPNIPQTSAALEVGQTNGGGSDKSQIDRNSFASPLILKLKIQKDFLAPFN